MYRCPNCDNELRADAHHPGKVLCYTCMKRYSEDKIAEYWALHDAGSAFEDAEVPEVETKSQQGREESLFGKARAEGKITSSSPRRKQAPDTDTIPKPGSKEPVSTSPKRSTAIPKRATNPFSAAAYRKSGEGISSKGYDHNDVPPVPLDLEEIIKEAETAPEVVEDIAPEPVAAVGEITEDSVVTVEVEVPPMTVENLLELHEPSESVEAVHIGKKKKRPTARRGKTALDRVKHDEPEKAEIGKPKTPSPKSGDASAKPAENKPAPEPVAASEPEPAVEEPVTIEPVSESAIPSETQIVVASQMSGESPARAAAQQVSDARLNADMPQMPPMDAIPPGFAAQFPGIPWGWDEPYMPPMGGFPPYPTNLQEAAIFEQMMREMPPMDGFSPVGFDGMPDMAGMPVSPDMQMPPNMQMPPDTQIPPEMFGFPPYPGPMPEMPGEEAPTAHKKSEPKKTSKSAKSSKKGKSSRKAKAKKNSSGPQGQLAEDTAKRGFIISIASLATGVLALALCWIHLVNVGATLLGLIAVALGVFFISQMKKGFSKGFMLAIAGAAIGFTSICAALLMNTALSDLAWDPFAPSGSEGEELVINSDDGFDASGQLQQPQQTPQSEQEQGGDENQQQAPTEDQTDTSDDKVISYPSASEAKWCPEGDFYFDFHPSGEDGEEEPGYVRYHLMGSVNDPTAARIGAFCQACGAGTVPTNCKLSDFLDAESKTDVYITTDSIIFDMVAVNPTKDKLAIAQCLIGAVTAEPIDGRNAYFKLPGNMKLGSHTSSTFKETYGEPLDSKTASNYSGPDEPVWYKYKISQDENPTLEVYFANDRGSAPAAKIVYTNPVVNNYPYKSASSG